MKVSNINWEFHHFNQLNVSHLYRLLKLRQEIFIVEQNSPYQDIDELDCFSYHLLGYNNEVLSAYLRIVPPNKKYKEPSLGRIVVSKFLRGHGLGTELVKQGMKHTMDLYKTGKIRIQAQSHLQKFYEKIGYKTVTDTYMKDGIPHIEMLTS
ncbi:MAG: GNAT family N-acetyltransferase [Balneolaceae bacterium]